MAKLLNAKQHEIGKIMTWPPYKMGNTISTFQNSNPFELLKLKASAPYNNEYTNKNWQFLCIYRCRYVYIYIIHLDENKDVPFFPNDLLVCTEHLMQELQGICRWLAILWDKWINCEWKITSLYQICHAHPLGSTL